MAAVPKPDDPMQRVAAMLLQEQRLAEAADLTEFGYRLVNETRGSFDYRSAVLWREAGLLRPQLEAVSGIPRPVADAPFSQWASALCRHLAAKAGDGPLVVTAGDLPTAVAADWADYLPARTLWLPLRSNRGERLGGLLLAREQAWREEELRALERLAQVAAVAMELLVLRGHKRPWLRRLATRRTGWVLALLLIAALWLPVRLSVLSPAEVVPKSPLVIRAPIDGVIDHLTVVPNQQVAAGDLLLRLDDTGLRARLQVAEQELAIARAEYRLTEQVAVAEREASARLRILRARVERQNAEVDYVKTLLQRVELRAEQDGIVILHDEDKLTGKPVKLGERLLVLADPARAQVEAWLAVGDSIPLAPGAPVELFLNVKPEQPIAARLRFVNFEADLSPEGQLAFRLVADLNPGEPQPRIGWRGTAKLHGEEVPLYYYLLRRPLAALRQFLGL